MVDIVIQLLVLVVQEVEEEMQFLVEQEIQVEKVQGVTEHKLLI